jgi:hypothetical protein
MPAHLVHGPAQVLDDVELVEHQQSLRCMSLDDVDLGLPHVAADAFRLPRAAPHRGSRRMLPECTAPGPLRSNNAHVFRL